jgi:spore germination protein GerM
MSRRLGGSANRFAKMMRERRLTWIGLLVIAVATLVAAIVFVNLHQPDSVHYQLDLTGRGTALRPVVVYFVSADSAALAPGRREVLAEESRQDLARDLVAFLSQPSPGLEAPLPTGTELVHYFEDGEGTAVLDFNGRFTAVEGKGILEERLKLSAFVRTLGENLPNIREIRVLVDGRPLTRWGEHLEPGSRLEVASW